METTYARILEYSRWLSQPRVRAFSIAVVVLAILAVLQINNLKSNAPMCELLTGCRLQREDVQRMQIAFSRAGMRDFEVRDDVIFVPTARHAEFMKVATDNNAIPASLMSDDEGVSTVTPFLSRSQQKSLEWKQKKQQVRDMVIRLPFVEQAWFEMDRTESTNVFRPTPQSAVISIRSPEDIVLTDRDVETVRLMISGAISGLAADDIVVIDLANGYAHHFMPDEMTEQQIQAQRVVFNQKRFYESRIREALSEYPDLKIRVDVDVQQTQPMKEKVAEVSAVPVVQPLQTAEQPKRDVLPSPGANGVVSIEVDSESVEAPVIQRVAYQPPLPILPHWERRIAVSIDVPVAAVYAVLGTPEASGKGDLSGQGTVEQQTRLKFQQFRSDILAKLTTVLPEDTEKATEKSIAVNLLPSTPQPVAVNNWSWASELLNRNWPSIAVMVIGLTLVMLVSRSGERDENATPIVRRNQDVLSINGASLSEGGIDPEVRLSQMIEEDPDAAAKIIESWIRDAA